MRPHAVGAEVVKRQVAQVRCHEEQHAHKRKAGDYPLYILVDKAEQQPVVDEHRDNHRQQHDIFPERLPVGEVDGVAEAAAVGNGIGKGEVERQRRHQHHEHQRGRQHCPSADGKEQTDANGELEDAEQHRGNHQHTVGDDGREPERLKVVSQLIDGAQRVNRLHEAREEKDSRQDEAQRVNQHAEHHPTFFASVRHHSLTIYFLLSILH